MVSIIKYSLIIHSEVYLYSEGIEHKVEEMVRIVEGL